MTKFIPPLLLCVLILLTGTAWSLAAEAELLGMPPTLPARPAAIKPEADWEHTIYLPLVLRPVDPPAWIDTQSRTASLLFYQQEYLGSALTDASWTGNHTTCSPGETSPAFREAILRRINYFRSMAGIPAVVAFKTDYTTKAQAAALMMSVNRKLSHTPDASWLCYSEAGREGAGSSNLYLGVYGPQAISGYVSDPGTGNYFVGHRRWILYPQTKFMGTGDIPPTDGYPAANALWVFDLENIWGPRPATRESYVAWPPPGYVPYQVVYPRWSFAIAGADFTSVAVSMSLNGQTLALTRDTPVNGYGENTLVWEPVISFTAPTSDTYYQVMISGVLVGEKLEAYTYTVIVFNPDQ
jgi:uncharacterized protein YkwD